MIKIVRPATFIFLAATLISCGQEEQDQNTASSPVQVDLILTNGKVLTVDDSFSIHNTVVVNDGRIIQTGPASITENYDSRVSG